MATVQFDHRILAVGTLAAYTAVYMKARKPNVWGNLPEEARTALNLTIAAVGGQVPCSCLRSYRLSKAL